MADENKLKMTTSELEQIMNLPERVFTIGGKECRGLFDENESRFYLLNEDGKFSGKSAVVKKTTVPTHEDLEETTKKPEPPEQDTEQESEDSETENSDEEVEEDGHQRKKKMIILGAGVLILLLALFIFIPKLFGGKTPSPAPTDNPTEQTNDPSQAVDNIDVVQIIVDLKPGDTITEENIKCVSIKHDAYNQISVVSDIYKWEDSTNLIGKYINSYVSAGQYLYLENVSSVYTPQNNPWINEEPGYVYIDIPLLPADVEADKVCFGEIFNLSIQKRTVSETPNENDDTETPPEAIEGLEHQTSVQQSVVIDSYQVAKLIVCDIVNADGESLYEYYISYMGIPAGKQPTYLQQALKKDEELETSLTPSTIRVKVSSAQAAALGDLTADNVTLSFSFIGEVDVTTEAKVDFAAEARALYNTIQSAIEVVATADVEEGE